MIQINKEKWYTVPGSYSIGEAFAGATVLLILQQKKVLWRVTRGTNHIKQIQERYKVSAKNLIGYGGPDMPDFMTFGILWNEVGPEMVGQNNAKIIEDRIVRGVDVIDSGAGWKPLKDISILTERAGLDTAADIKTDFTKKIKSCRMVLLNAFSELDDEAIIDPII